MARREQRGETHNRRTTTHMGIRKPDASGERQPIVAPSALMVTPARFERATYRLGIWRSILLSYGAIDAMIPVVVAPV